MTLFIDKADKVKPDLVVDKEKLLLQAHILREQFRSSEKFLQLQQDEIIARAEGRIVQCHYCLDEVICDTVQEANTYKSVDKYKCYDCIEEGRVFRLKPRAKKKEPSLQKFKRTCPKCGNSIVYTSRAYFVAQKKDSLCKSCSKRGKYTTPVY